MKTLKYILLAAICSFAFAACENMDWLHKEYLQNLSMHSAELPYVKVNAGFERVEVEWAHPTDQVSTGLRISYGLGNNLKEIILSAEDVQNSVIGTWKNENLLPSTSPGTSGDSSEEGEEGEEGDSSEEEDDGVIVEVKEYPLCRYEITGLSEFNTYFFYICSLDNFGNPSLITETNAEIYTKQKFGGENFPNVIRPKFYLYDNTKTDPNLSGHRLVIKELSGIINLCSSIEWKLKSGETVIAEGEYDRAEKDAEIENGNQEQTNNLTTLYWDRQYERSLFVELSNEWDAIKGVSNEERYTIEYTYNFHPCVFMDKFGVGYYYQSVCVDCVSLDDTQDIEVEELGWKIEDPNSHLISKNLWSWFWWSQNNIDYLKGFYGSFWSELRSDVDVERMKASYPMDVYPYLYESETTSIKPASFYQDPTTWNKHSPERLSDDMLMVDPVSTLEAYMDSYWRAAQFGEYPYSLIFSTGQEVMLNRIGMTFARDFENIGSPGVYELWISNDKTEEDGILDDWELVGTFDQTVETMGEYAYTDKYIDGITFRLFEDPEQMTRRCRHIRIRVLKDINGLTTSIPAISEIFLYGIEGSELPPAPADDDEPGSGDDTLDENQE